MAKFNLSIYLNSYQDSNPSNNPDLSNFRWNRVISALCAGNPVSISETLAPGETKTFFNGIRSLAQDGTTEYDIAVKPLSSNTYTLKASAGTLPNFRTPRATSADATTQVTVTKNGPLVTFTSTGGTAFNLAAVVVGDYARIGNLFATGNQKALKIVAKTATSFSVENKSGVAEGPITLGSGFADQVQIYSAAGVQIGDTLVIDAGFSLIDFGSYKVTDVSANSLEFYSTALLPDESGVQTNVKIYSDAKQFVYVESNKKCSLNINSAAAGSIEPFQGCASGEPGVFMRKSTMYSMSVTNDSTDPANIFIAMIE